jgi:repressor LexA
MSARPALTALQSAVLDEFVKNEESGHAPPTYSELCAKFGWSSTAAARNHVDALVKKGMLRRDEGGRRGAHIARQLPLVMGEGAAAGEAMRTLSEIEVPRHLMPTSSGFTLNVMDTSMVAAGVLQWDVVVAEENSVPRAGDLVVVEVEGKLLVRELIRGGKQPLVRNAPRSRRPSTRDGAQLRGVVVGLMRRYGADE